MRSVAIFLLILVISSNATSIFERYPMKFGGTRSIMTLLTQIEETMKNGGPLDAVEKKLEEFRLDIVTEQRSHDGLWAEQQQQCGEELNYRKSEIATAQNVLTEGKGALESCTAQRNRASADLSTTQDQLISNQNGLSEITRQRSRERYSFETLANVWQLTSEAVAGALQILDEMWSQAKSQSAGFLEMTAHVNTILSHSIKMGGKLHGLGNLMQALAQLKTTDLSADEALFDRVKTLLKNFKEKKEQEFLAASAAEDVAQNEFNAGKQRYDTVISHLSQQQGDLDNELKQLNKCIVVQTGVINSAQAKLDRNQELLDNAGALCQSAADEYTSSTEKRKQELDLLAQIRERVKVRFSQISEGVTERGKQDEFSYENKYVGFVEEAETEEESQ